MIWALERGVGDSAVYFTIAMIFISPASFLYFIGFLHKIRQPLLFSVWHYCSIRLVEILICIGYFCCQSKLPYLLQLLGCAKYRNCYKQ